MFTQKRIYEAGTYLGKHLTSNDYYNENEKVTGTWIGNGAEIFGFRGARIEKGDQRFENIRQGFHPETGSRILQRYDKKRIAFYDFQVGAPKSVSIMAVAFDDKRLIEAHQKAVGAGMKELEGLMCRRLRDGEKVKTQSSKKTGNLVAAQFTHDNSRNLDPQLHTHNVIGNMTYDEDTGKWFAAENSQMVRYIDFAGRVYQNVLREEVHQLGYETEDVLGKSGLESFRVKGISVSEEKVNSTRSVEKELGIAFHKKLTGRVPSKQQVDNIVAATPSALVVEYKRILKRDLSPKEITQIKEFARSAKMKESSKSLVKEIQHSKFTPDRIAELYGLRDQSIKRSASIDNAIDHSPGDLEEALNSAINHLYERDSVISETKIIGETLKRNLGKFSLGDIKEAVSKNSELVKLEENPNQLLTEPDQRLFTTKTTLRQELNILGFVNQGISQCNTFGKATDGSIYETGGKFHSEDFKIANGLLENSSSLDLKVSLNAAIEEKMITPALRKPLEELRNSGKLSNRELETIDKALTPLRATKEQREITESVMYSKDRLIAIRGVAGAGKSETSKKIKEGLELAGHKLHFMAPTALVVQDMKREIDPNATTVHGFLATAKSATEKIKGSVLFIDEAGLMDSKTGSELINVARENDCRIILLGDTKQHRSIGAGNTLEIVEKFSNAKRNEILGIQRQRHEELRETVSNLSQGNGLSGMKELEKNGYVKETEHYISEAANDFLSTNVKENREGKKYVNEEGILMCPTWKENFEVTDRVREGLKKEGIIGDGRMINTHVSAYWTIEDKSNRSHFEEGMSITLTQKIGNIDKGTTYTVMKDDPNHHSLLVKDREGKIYDFEPEKIPNKFDVGVHKKIEASIGDLLLIKQNLQKYNLTNGEKVKLLHFDDEKQKMIVESGHGKNAITKEIPYNFPNFNHGYAITTTKAQGATHEKAILCGETFTNDVLYVGVSRAKETVKIYCPDLDSSKAFLTDSPQIKSMAIGHIFPRTDKIEYNNEKIFRTKAQENSVQKGKSELIDNSKSISKDQSVGYSKHLEKNPSNDKGRDQGIGY